MSDVDVRPDERAGEQQQPRTQEPPREEPPRERARKKRRFAIFGLLFLALAIIVAIPVYFYYAARESTDDAQIEGHITPISARVGGTVLEVLVNDNQQVKAGDVLARIDPRDYQVALAHAQGDLADALANENAARTNVPLTGTSARANLQTAQAGVHEAQTGVDAAKSQLGQAEARLSAMQAQVQQAEANQRKAEQDLARFTQLVQKDEISRQQYDAAVAAAAAARATTEAARAAVAEAQRGVATAQAGIAQAQARVAQAQAALQNASTVPQQISVTQSRASSAGARVQQGQAAVQRAQLDLEYTIVKAPVAGVVSRKTVEVGQVIAPNQQLMVVVPLDDLWVVANFKETQLKNMRPGQKVTIDVDALGGREFHGHVDSFAGATGARFSLLPPENATGNYVKVVQRIPVKILFERGEDPEHLLRPGMSVEPTVIVR